MKYQYNYGFFDEWIKENPQIKKNVLQKALGVKADSGIRKWIDRQRPMPVVSMLRFCNSFNVPLSAFFRDADADTYTTTIPQPNINDQLEPDGGYLKNDQNRQRGEHSILDPLDVDVVPSYIPGSINDTQRYNADAMRYDNNNDDESESSSSQKVMAITPMDAKELIALENKHSDERKTLLAIIEDLQKQNASLLKIVEDYKAKAYQVTKIYEPEQRGYAMVAENDVS